MNQFTMEDDQILFKFPTEKTLEKMVYEEERVRHSKEYISSCSAVKNIPNGWLNVTATAQEDIVKKFGYQDDVSKNVACNMLRRARYLFPNNPIFHTVPVYVRENKANKGFFKPTNLIPDIDIFNRTGNIVKLFDVTKNNLNIFFAGSHT